METEEEKEAPPGNDCLAEGKCDGQSLNETDSEPTESFDVQNGLPDGKKEFDAPAVGMEFESYDDAYNYYNCYAKEAGFRVRVKNSWFKRNSREKYGAVLCCSCQGFKRIKDVNRLRKETRTGCPAMLRMRVVDSKRWRVLEVTHEHNHLLGAKINKSVKKMGSGTKSKLQSSSDAEVRTIKLYRALVIDAGGNENPNSNAVAVRKFSDHPNQLNLRKGDSQAIYNYLCRLQLTNPNFFYLMDFNDEGHLRNVFWCDSRYRCKALQNAIMEVFPKSNHRFSLSFIMRRVPEKLGGLRNYDAIRKMFVKAAFETLKVIEFEAAWGFMVQHFGVADHEWLRSLYEDRAQWAPVYLKDTFFAGLSASRPGENLSPFFDKYVHKQTPLKEFLDKYELALQKKLKEESLADIESRNTSPALKTRCSFELQLSKLYTREIFKRFQLEVEEMYSCFSTTQLHVDGPIIIFLVKERVLAEGNRREIRDYEVLYDRTASEVRCICSCFNFYGYLCRHALCVLNFNGVEEVPSKYILSRWKKDYKRFYVPDQGSNNGDAVDRMQWFNQLYRSALQVVEEGAVSLDHYKAALQAFEESLNRVHESISLSSLAYSYHWTRMVNVDIYRLQRDMLKKKKEGGKKRAQ
ncbi:hypothetical protein V6N11_064351 [Hibiscus sabdariffa]|uniref:Protein FAR1-RELATED SEQUENCE n=1 Tax=Hibiscus sabdariffa TaxID=183260 RepID=A0ABR2PNB6_9ROSI